MKKNLLLLILTLFCFNTNAENKEEFTKVFIFGDSFSYQGTWSELLAKKYGFNYIQNQTGFAVGGGKTSDLNNMLSNYNTSIRSFDPNALYLIYFGPSDVASSANNYLIEILSRGVPNPITGNLDYKNIFNQLNNQIISFNAAFPLTFADIKKRANDLGIFIKEISAKGANYIIVLNNFNDSLRQGYLADPQLDFFFPELLADLYNQQIYTNIQIQAPNANIIYVDTKRLLSEITVNAAIYFSATNLENSFKKQGFFDLQAHPTMAGHQILSQYVASIIESPSRVAMVRELPLTTGESSFRNTRALAETQLITPREKRFSVDINGEYHHIHTNSLTNKELGFKNSNIKNGEIIINIKTLEDLTLGTKVGKSEIDFKFINGYGKANIKEDIFSIHAIYNLQNQAYIYSSCGIGKLKYAIRRHIPIGITNIMEQGVSDGKHFFTTLGSGYNFIINKNVSLIPFLSANYQSITIKPYREHGDIRSTTMYFDIPRRQSLASEIGTTLTGDIKLTNIQIKPSLTFAYAYDFKNQLRTNIKAHVSDMPKSFFVPAYKIEQSSFYIAGKLQTTINETYSLGVNSMIKSFGQFKQWSLGFNGEINF